MSTLTTKAIRFATHSSKIGQLVADMIAATQPEFAAVMDRPTVDASSLGLDMESRYGGVVNYIIEQTMGEAFRTDADASDGAGPFYWLIIDDGLLWGGTVLKPDQIINLLFGENLQSGRSGRHGIELAADGGGFHRHADTILTDYSSPYLGDGTHSDGMLPYISGDMLSSMYGMHGDGAGEIVEFEDALGGGRPAGTPPSEYGSNISIVNGMLSTAMFGTSIICSPPLLVRQTHIDSGLGDIYGFFSHKCPFQMGTKWSVFADVSDSYGSMLMWLAIITDGGGTAEEAWSASAPVEDFGYLHKGALETYPDDTWTELEPFAGLDGDGTDTNYSPSRDLYNEILNYASHWETGATFAVEAMGIDSFDTIIKGSVDSNEFLHSSELYIVENEGSQFEVIRSVTKISDGFAEISLGPQASMGGARAAEDVAIHLLKSAARTRYCALDDNSHQATGRRTAWSGGSDSLFEYPYGVSVSDLNSNVGDVLQLNPWDSWVGTHAWERQASLQATHRMCQLIQEEYTTIDIPKKLINKVQRRREIPNHLVSSFGYHAADDTDYSSTTATSEWMSTVSFDYSGEATYGASTEVSGDMALYGKAEGGAWDGMTWDEYVFSSGGATMHVIDHDSVITGMGDHLVIGDSE